MAHSTGRQPSKPGAGNREKEKTLLDRAIAYARRGWSIIPTTGKKAACKWTEFQTTPATEARIRQLFRLRGIEGLAVIFGPVSGGLACRDFDDQASFDK
jgi:Bifunctional DNA primase/polymerase, N-terminal